MSLPFVLIPVKSLTHGKTRLAGLLEPERRRRLNRSFLSRALSTAIAFAGTKRCAVVSPCDEVLEFADDRGVQAIRQREHNGLNPGVTQGVRELRAMGACDVLVISCDVPLVRPSDLSAVSDRGRSERVVVIGEDRHGLGTNLIYLPSGISLPFHFGEGSLARHVQAVRLAGGEPLVYFNERIAFDVDTPDDYAVLAKALPGISGWSPSGQPASGPLNTHDWRPQARWCVSGDLVL